MENTTEHMSANENLLEKRVTGVASVDDKLYLNIDGLTVEVVGFPDASFAWTEENLNPSAWNYCPNCGSLLDEPAGRLQDQASCPDCGKVQIQFHINGGGRFG